MVNLQTQTKDQLRNNLLIGLIRVARPIHWVKNLAVFAALVFSGGLFDRELFIVVFLAFLAFNLATSSAYILNDIRDADLDRQHPRKKYRPIASGLLPKKLALLYAFGLASASLVWSYSLSPPFFYLIASTISAQAFPGSSSRMKHSPTKKPS